MTAASLGSAAGIGPPRWGRSRWNRGTSPMTNVMKYMPDSVNGKPLALRFTGPIRVYQRGQPGPMSYSAFPSLDAGNIEAKLPYRGTSLRVPLSPAFNPAGWIYR